VNFQKGNKAGKGRPPGSKNKKKIAKVADFLAENNINPAEQILAILAAKDSNGSYTLKNPKDRADIWLDLLSYCQGKPKEIENDGSDFEDIDDFDDVSNEQLLTLIKTPGNA